MSAAGPPQGANRAPSGGSAAAPAASVGVRHSSTSAVRKHRANLVIGGIGLFVSAGYLAMTVRLPFGAMDRPGAGVFPLAVGIVMLIASLFTMWEGWRFERSERVAIPRGTDRRRLLALVGLLLGYFLALPWLGQAVTSTLFCILLMRMLSALGWTRIIVYSLVISLVLYGLFVVLLKVPMPRGVLGL